MADALKRTEDGAGLEQSSAALHVLCHFEFSFLFDMMTMDLFFWFLMLRIQHVAFGRQSSTGSLDELLFSEQLAHVSSSRVEGACQVLHT